MNVKQYDVIVIGVGSMGATTCYELAARKYKVLGIEQFSSPHPNGSHAGQSRIIRKAYFEHPGYVPLLEQAYKKWSALEQQCNEQVYYKTGLLYNGPIDHPIITGTKNAAGIHSIGLNKQPAFNADFHFPGGTETILEPDAGFLRPEKIITIYKELAKKNGADIRENEKVTGWEKHQELFTVTTDKGSYQCHKLIITAGAWSNKLIPALDHSLKITRQLIVWVRPGNSNEFEPSNFPCWMIADHKRKGVLYGFPYLNKEQFGEPDGMKFAWHHPLDQTDPDKVNREISGKEIRELIEWVSEYIPSVKNAQPVIAKTCLYANSPDENFIIDHLPGYDKGVTIACGFSGHGFKFVSVIGEILADLATEGKTIFPIEFLGLERFTK